jgi:hypothetical protein
MSFVEQLGVVTSRTGVLVLIDTGYLNLWSHDRTPVMPEDVLDVELTANTNSWVDLKIVGADAERAGRLLEMSSHPLYVFDQPPDHPELQAKLEKLVHEQGMDARFEVISPRIPHRQRVDLTLAYGKGAGEIQFHGIWAVAVSGVPTLRPLRVLGKRCAAPDSDCWSQITVECRPNSRIALSEKLGVVGVDYARILIADVDALGLWKHEESLDGLADYVFWGRDAERVASAVKAPRLNEGEFGWLNVPIDTAAEHGTEVEEYRDQHSFKMAGDFRPHSHHWRVMKPTRENTVTESGTTELDGMTVCNFMTTWGDGVFEVYRELDESGELSQIRIEMETQPNAT